MYGYCYSLYNRLLFVGSTTIETSYILTEDSRALMTENNINLILE